MIDAAALVRRLAEAATGLLARFVESLSPAPAYKAVPIRVRARQGR